MQELRKQRGRPSKIEEFKKLLLQYKAEVENACYSFAELASYLKMRGLDVDPSTLVNWCYKLDGKSFDGVTIHLIGGKWQRWSPPQPPDTQPIRTFYNRALGVEIVDSESLK
jgi:hypothetical protein